MIAALALAAMPFLAQVDARVAALPLCEVPVAIARDRPSYWSGFAWAAAPALLDLGTMEYCLAHSPTCYERAGDRVFRWFAKGSGVVAQAAIDRQIREGQHPKRVRYLRAASVLTQVVFSAVNLHHAGR